MSFTPSNVQVTAQVGGFEITWENPAVPDVTLHHYNVQKKKSAESTWETVIVYPFDILVPDYLVATVGAGLIDYDIRVCGANSDNSITQCVTQTKLNTIVTSSDLKPTELTNY